MGYGYLAEGLLQGVLQACQNKGHAVELVGFFSWTATQQGQHCSDVGHRRCMTLAKQIGVPLIKYDSVNEYSFSAYLQKAQPDVVLVGSWGEILKSHLVQNVHDQSTPQFINCHPAKLPKHRGANPYASVIAEGETESGVTFHTITDDIDAGAIWLQDSVPVSETETGDSLRQKCSDKARELVPVLLTGFINETLLPEEQDETKASYYPPLTRESGQLDFTQPPEALERLSRALVPWMKPYGTIRDGSNRVKEVFVSVDAVRLVNKDACPQKLCHRERSANAGTILSIQGKQLWVQSSEESTLLALSVHQVYTNQFGWLPMLSGVVLPVSVKAGDCFEQQPT